MSNLEKFQYYLRDLESPNLFITWNYYFVISAVLGRKVWVGGGSHFPFYPNIYVFVVGPPGVGKTQPAAAAKTILETTPVLLRDSSGKPTGVELPLAHVAPDSATLEGLWKDMERSETLSDRTDKEKTKYVHSSMAFFLVNELGTLFRKDTGDLILFLTTAWDCSNSFKQHTKSSGDVYIQRPCLSMLGCCTDDWMNEQFANAVIKDGLAARVIFLYGASKRQVVPRIIISPEQEEAVREIKEHLRKIAVLCGEVKLTAEAEAWFDTWYMENHNVRLNKAPLLRDYYARKKVHLMKLAMLIHFGERTEMLIEVDTFKQALAYLNATEVLMHKGLGGGSTNPQYDLAMRIWRGCAGEGKKFSQVVLEEFGSASVKDIGEAVEWLEMVGGVKRSEGVVKRTGMMMEEES